MSVTSITASPDPRAKTLLVDEPHEARSCACERIMTAFTALESVPGPRVRRAAQGDDAVIECVDPQDTENEPATMMQRIPA